MRFLLDTRRRVTWLLAVALVALAGVTAPATASRASTPPVAAPHFTHVFEVVMENLGYQEAMQTPGLAALAHHWAYASNYYGVAHPSLPNYLGLAAGNTFGINSDCVTCYVRAPNLFTQLSARHVSFNAYLEGVPSSCYLDPWGGNDYASKHNPFRYFLDVRSSKALCAHLRPLSELAGVLHRASASVPRFVWVTPNLCHDGHDCAPATAAAWLGSFVREVTASAAWRDGGVLFVTWDEGNGDSSGVRAGRVVASGGGGRVLTLVVAPHLAHGASTAVPLNHYSLLATVEDALGLARLANARGATTFAPLFRHDALAHGG